MLSACAAKKIERSWRYLPEVQEKESVREHHSRKSVRQVRMSASTLEKVSQMTTPMSEVRKKATSFVFSCYSSMQMHCRSWKEKATINYVVLASAGS